MRFRSSPATWMLFMALMVSHAGAQSAGSVAGTVKDAQDRAVAGATVTLEPAGLSPRRQTTDADGRFRFDGVAGGQGVLRVAAPGFAEIRHELSDTRRAVDLQLRLPVASVRTAITVMDTRSEDVRADIEATYNRNKSVAALDGQDLTKFNPVANYAALRLLPGVMSAGAGGRDRFSLPTHIRGGHAWGIVETVDDYPAINITPVSAEDGGYTAGFSSVIPSIAVQSLSVATGGLGVSYGQASGGVVRNAIKRGAAGKSSASVRLEVLSLGEGIGMADTGGTLGPVDYYAAGQSSLADYGTAYETFPRPIQALRLGSGIAKVGVRTSRRGRWETVYVGGDERHEYFQDSMQAGQAVRRDYHTDKSNHFVASRYDWRQSDDLVFGMGVTQHWFHENRIEEVGPAAGVSRRNRPQRATRAFTNFHWRAELSDSVAYSASGGGDLSWDRFQDLTNQPVSFSFREQAGYWRNSLALPGSVTLNAGVRVANLNNGFRNDVRALYDAGAAWIAPVTETRLFGSWSTGYKLNKAFYLWWGNGQFIRREPATGLRPSGTATVELGAEQPVSFGGSRAGSVRVSVFQTRESDLFNFGNTATGIPFYDAARTRGAELWTEWRIWRLRPFASFTWLRSYRDASTNPNAANVDLRFAPLPNYASGFGAQVDLHPRLILSLSGFYDDGGVSQQMLNDQVLVTRYGSFSKVNASAAWMFSSRWGIFSRIENLLHRRDLGFDRTTINPDGTAQRIAGTQRDPGFVISAGFQVQF